MLIAIGLFFSDTAAWAADVKLIPKLSLSGGYDDNITYVQDNKLDSTFINTKPGLILDYETLLSALKLSAELNIRSYLDENDFDRVDQNYGLNGNHRLGERWDTRIGFQYITDTTLNTYLDETGRLTDQVDRDYYYATTGLSYDMTRVASIDLDYQFRHAQYDSDVYSDYDLHRLFLMYRHQLKNEIDTLLVGPSAYYRTNDYNDTDYLSLDLGWRRNWSEITNSYISIGARYVTVDKKDSDETNNNWGAIARINLTHSGLASKIKFQYYHDLATTVEGRDVNVDNFWLEFDYLMTERFGVGIDGRLVFSYDLFSNNEETDKVQDRRYFMVEPFVFYRLTENFKAYLRYGYQNSSDDPIENDNAKERNRAWIEFRYEFPILM